MLHFFWSGILIRWPRSSPYQGPNRLRGCKAWKYEQVGQKPAILRRNSWFSDETWWFSIVMWVYQRVLVPSNQHPAEWPGQFVSPWRCTSSTPWGMWRCQELRCEAFPNARKMAGCQVVPIFEASSVVLGLLPNDHLILCWRENWKGNWLGLKGCFFSNNTHICVYMCINIYINK